MGLTLHYDWKTKCDSRAARRLIVKFHAIAEKLGFDHISKIFEQDPPDGKTSFELFEDEKFRQGDVYVSRRRADGEEEVVRIPGQHAVFFHVRNEGAETALVGLASHPPVVIHREDVIHRHADGREKGRDMNAGHSIEFPTRRRGYYSWHSHCKTQYAGNPRHGGEANFLRAHLTLVELFDQIADSGVKVRMRDDSKYAKHRDVDRLLKSLRSWNAIVAQFVGTIKDALGDQAGAMAAPITDRPDFEHLEAKGIDEIRMIARRHRRRKGK